MLTYTTDQLYGPELQQRARLTDLQIKRRRSHHAKLCASDFVLTIGAGDIGVLVSGSTRLPVQATADDYPLIRLFKWRLNNNSRSAKETWYAYSSGTGADGRLTSTLYLHRLLLVLPAGEMVDHENQDTLDNRRPNLRRAPRPPAAHKTAAAAR